MIDNYKLYFLVFFLHLTPLDKEDDVTYLMYMKFPSERFTRPNQKCRDCGF